MSAVLGAVAAKSTVVDVLLALFQLGLSPGGQDVLQRYFEDHGISAASLEVALANRPHVDAPQDSPK